MPPVIAPSPIMAATLLVFPRISLAVAKPKAAEILVLACPAPKTSYSLSLRFKNPDKPSLVRIV